MQAVATYVLGDPSEVIDHIAASRRLHARVAKAVHTELVRGGTRCRAPAAGFYVYPDFEPLGRALSARGISTSNELATSLLDQHGVAVLPGTVFGDPPSVLTARVATSLLYGTTADERWAALEADEPEKLPWVAASLAKLRHELGVLAGLGD
jgi:aspartate aminotransferase